MPLFDCECEKCGHIWPEFKSFRDPAPECPACGSNFTKTRFPTPNIGGQSKQPYDLLDSRIPDEKPIKSFANDKRKGGKDTT